MLGVNRFKSSPIQNQRCELAAWIETPLSAAVACYRQQRGWSTRFGPRKGHDNAGSGVAMLSIQTLWTVFIVNFLALSVIWAYVMRSYPKLEAARFWMGSAVVAVLGGLISILRQDFDSLLPLLAGGTLMVFAACLAAMGVACFYGRPVRWLSTALVAAGTFAGLLFFAYGYDSRSLRATLYTLAQC